MVGYVDLISKIRKIWKRKEGLILILCLLNYLLYNYLPKSLIFGIEVLVYTLSNIAVFVTWFFASNRFVFRGNKEMVLAILITCEEEKTESNIQKIIKKSINQIKITHGLEGIKIVILPGNLLEDDKKKIEKYWLSRKSFLDGIIHLKMESGHYDSVEMMKIKQFGFIGDFNGKGQLQRIFFDNLDLAKDISLTQEGKDWRYIYLNDGNDKLKIKENLFELLIHYIGIYSIILGKDDLALNCLRSIFKPDNRKVNIKKGEKKSIAIKSEVFISARIAGILINLYSKIASSYMNEGKIRECLNTLMECEGIIEKHKYSFQNYVTMARMNFELGELKQAKKYNNKAFETNSYQIQTLVNKAWFSIVEKKPEKVAIYFQRIIKRKGANHDVNWVDVVEFYERYRNKYPDCSLLIDFGQAIFLKLFIKDHISADKLLKKLKLKTQGNTEYLCLYRVLIGGQLKVEKKNAA